jgi:hypothetical protein
MARGHLAIKVVGVVPFCFLLLMMTMILGEEQRP